MTGTRHKLQQIAGQVDESMGRRDTNNNVVAVQDTGAAPQFSPIPVRETWGVGPRVRLDI